MSYYSTPSPYFAARRAGHQPPNQRDVDTLVRTYCSFRRRATAGHDRPACHRQHLVPRLSFVVPRRLAVAFSLLKLLTKRVADLAFNYLFQRTDIITAPYLITPALYNVSPLLVANLHLLHTLLSWRHTFFSSCCRCCVTRGAHSKRHPAIVR